MKNWYNNLSKSYQQVGMEGSNRKGRFLDVTEYVLKEYSPITRALNPDPRAQQRNYHLERYTPQIAPIDHDGSTLKITPFLNGLIDMADNQFEQFILDSDLSGSLESKVKEKFKVERIKTRARSNSLVLFHLDNELQGIDEQDDFQFNSAQQSSSHLQDFDEAEQQEKSGSEHSLDPLPDFDQAQLYTQIEFREKIEKYAKDPKQNLIKQIRRISQFKESTENQKLEKMKILLQGFMLDFQIPSFQEAWQNLGIAFSQRINSICKGIDQNFKRKIGSLTFEGRRMKLLKYLQKKRLRRWRKKVSYDCRKKVADSRLRIKGKFVNREQVCEQLGMTLEDICNYTAQEIRQLLERKIEERKQKSLSQ